MTLLKDIAGDLSKPCKLPLEDSLEHYNLDYGLLHYWKLDDLKHRPGTSVALDSKGSNDGNINGPVNCAGVSGRHPYGMAFGKVDDVIAVTYLAAPVFTLAVWIFPISSGEGNAGRIFDNEGDWEIALADFSTKKINFKMGGDSHNFGIGVLDKSVWYHLLATFDGTNMEMFINNVSLGTDTGSFTPAGNFSVIGIRTAGDREFEGRMAKMRFYEIVLPQIGISKLHREKL